MRLVVLPDASLSTVGAFSLYNKYGRYDQHCKDSLKKKGVKAFVLYM